MRVKKVLKSIAGLSRAVVVRGYEMVDADRPRLVIQVRVRQRRRGCCGRCGELASFYDQGGRERRWRHVDVGYATCELVGPAPRVDCPACGPTVIRMPSARHDSLFSRSLADLRPESQRGRRSDLRFPMMVDAQVRHTIEWYDQSAWPYPLKPGDRVFIRCDGGPGLSRLEVFPPSLELNKPGGTYVLADDGPPHDWIYHWMVNLGGKRTTR